MSVVDLLYLLPSSEIRDPLWNIILKLGKGKLHFFKNRFVSLTANSEKIFRFINEIVKNNRLIIIL